MSRGDFIAGSGADARIRLPEGAGRVEVRAADGARERCARAVSDSVSPAPEGAVASSPQRTESLARELVRSMLGATLRRRSRSSAASSPVPSGRSRRPESALVIGRGDEAGWIVDDNDLSRAHVEVRRGWDGVSVKDLGPRTARRSTARRSLLPSYRDGALVELGKLALRFRDPADRRIREPPPAPPTASSMFYVAIAIALLAVAGIVWILIS